VWRPNTPFHVIARLAARKSANVNVYPMPEAELSA
jgi:hypothetical protein